MIKLTIFLISLICMCFGGDNSAATAGATIYFVNDALDGVNGNVSTADVVIVGTATLDIDTLLAANFLFA